MAAAVMSRQLVDQPLARSLSPAGSVSIDIVDGTPDSPKAAQENGFSPSEGPDCREVTPPPQSNDSNLSGEHVRLGSADNADSDTVMQAAQPVSQQALLPSQEATAPMHEAPPQGLPPQSSFDEQERASASGLDSRAHDAVLSSVAASAASADNTGASAGIAPFASGSRAAADTELGADTLAQDVSADVIMDDGRAAASLVEDSGDDEPLVSMLSQSQELSASIQRSDIPEMPQKLEHYVSVQSQLDISPGSSSKGVAPIWNGDADATPDRKRAREQESDRSSSGSEDEEDGAAPGGRQQLASNTRKRRKNVLPVIKRNQRCGHCQTCLNPRMKKACLTRRAEMMKDMDKKGDLPLSLLASMGKQKGSLGATQKRSPPAFAASSDDEDAGAEPSSPWTRDLNALDLNNRGGLPRASKVPLFCRVLRGADSLDMRKVSLKILELSPREPLEAFVRSSEGLKTLGEWLAEAKPGNAPGLQLGRSVLALLGKLPIDVEALRISGIAKLVKGMGKKGPSELQGRAKQLVETWMKLLDSPATQKKPAPDPKKRLGAAQGLVRQDSDTKRAKGELQRDPSTTTSSLAAKPPTADNKAADFSKANVSKQAVSTAAADKAQQPPSPGAAAAAGSRGLLVASDFADLDTPPVPVKRAAPKEPPKKVQVLEGSNALKLADEHAASEPASAGAPAPSASVAPPAPVKIITPIGLPSQPKRTTVVSISGPRSFFGAQPSAGYTETRLGGPRPEKTDQRSAAERAIAAAAEIPDPEVDPKSPKRVKPKKVSWADDSLLQSVRLFSLTDPCNAVGSGEAQAHEEVLPVSERAVHATRPPGFENAARQEHVNEAAALRSMQQGVTPVPEIDDTDVSPEHDWYEPPQCVWWGPNPANPGQWELMLMPDHMYACGGESHERGEREAYRLMHPRVDFGLPGGVPAPPHPQELPSAQQWAVPGQVLRVPLEQRPPPQEQQQQQQQQPPAQTQPEAAPLQPAPSAQAAPLPLGGLNISAEQLQALLASVSQGAGSGQQLQLSQLASQLGQQQPQAPFQGTALPKMQMQAGTQQQQPQQQPQQLPAQVQLQAVPQQQPQQWSTPHQQAPQQAQAPNPMRLPVPSNASTSHAQQPFQQPQQYATQALPVRNGTAQPQQQQRPAPVVLKPPGQAKQPPPQQPAPIVLPRPGQPQRQPRPQAQQQPQAPVHQQRPPKSIRPPVSKPPVLRPPAQQANQGPRPRQPPPPPRPAPPVQHPPPAIGHSQHVPKSRTPCLYFNTPRGCRKGDRCEFVHDPARR